MKEGEVLLLLSKTNGDWWQVGFLAYVGFQFEIWRQVRNVHPTPIIFKDHLMVHKLEAHRFIQIDAHVINILVLPQ